MTQRVNELGQPIGDALAAWVPPGFPSAEAMDGRYCRLEKLDADRHAEGLHAANKLDADGRNWTYLPYGPFPSFDAYRTWLAEAQESSDPLFFAIVSKADGKAVGVAAYLRITPPAGSIEVGHLVFSERLKRSPAATEAMYLMMERAFESGYRRYEWKCDALNAASRSAAQRLGFSFEGIFRQAVVYKQRSRDTAWFAAIDKEWQTLRQAFASWLAPENFDDAGKQRSRLGDLTREALRSLDQGL